MKYLFLDVAKTIKVINNLLENATPSKCYAYMKDRAEHFNDRNHDIFSDNVLTLKQPTRDSAFYGIQTGKGNELLQAVKHEKKMSDDNMIGDNPNDPYYKKWIAYAERNNNGSSMFTLKNGKVYRLSRHDVRVTAMLFKQSLIEDVAFNTHFGQAFEYIRQSLAFTTGVQGSPYGDGTRIRSKRANGIIKHMFKMYLRAVKYHQGQSYQDTISLKNGIYHGYDFKVKYSQLFNMYVITRKGVKPTKHIKFVHAKNVALVAQSLLDRLVNLAQHFTNQDVDIDVKRDKWLQIAKDYGLTDDIKEWNSVA